MGSSEPGTSTSEFKVLLAAVGVSAVGLLITVLSNHAAFLTPSDIAALKEFLIASDAVGVAYIVSRGIRKVNTPG